MFAYEVFFWLMEQGFVKIFVGNFCGSASGTSGDSARKRMEGSF